MNYYRFLILFTIYLLFILNIKAATITDPLDKATYCTTDLSDTVSATSPPNKLWTCNVAGAITTILTIPGESSAEFSPSLVPGPYPATVIVRYQNGGVFGDGNTVYYEQTVTVTTPPAGVTFGAIPDVCESDVPFALTQGNPAGGTYGGTGVDGFGNFNPLAAGPGSHVLSYTYPSTGCSATEYQTIIVNANPIVSLAPFSDVCEGTAAFALSGGIPVGGKYSGTGVSGGNFDATVAGVGTHTITYTYTNGACSDSDNETITVNPLPGVTFIGYNGTGYCDVDPPVLFTGIPTDANGSFTGNGITDNGNGTADFNPGTSGLGFHDIIYTYTDANGCQNADTQSIRVGTLLTFNGLNSSYCEDVTNAPMTYNPVGGVFTALAGFTDNGDGTADFDPSVAGAGDHDVEYTYIGPLGCINILTQTVTVNALPLVNFVGLNGTYCNNDPVATLTGSLAPSGTFSGDGTTDNGDGTADLDPLSLAPGGPYSVTYSYTDAFGCSDDETKNFNIISLPTATISGDATICSGSNTNLTITFTGVSPYDVTYTDGTIPVTLLGVVSPHIFAVNPAINTTYTITSVTDANNCTNSGAGSATITVNPQVTITTDPANIDACPGDNINFLVIANGINLTYQWQKNAVDIVGETNATLVLNNIALVDVANYQCVVSSTCGGPVTSNAASLSLYDNTLITVQPVDANECEGDNVNFTVNATGSNLTYQWQKDGVDLVDGGSISGSNSNTLTITVLVLLDAGVYTCDIIGSCGSVTSDPANLSVDEHITITVQPQNNSACAGDNVNFSITATGTNLSYQWQKDGVDIVGETNPNLIINSIAAGDVGNYRCILSTPCGATLTSNNGSLTLNSLTAITVQPVDATECEGNNVNFSVTATGSNLLYQWQKDGVDLVDGGSIFGSTLNNLSITGLILADAGTYTCIVTGSCGIVNSNPAILTVEEDISITTQPSNVDACPGDNINFNIVATGSNLFYQWQKDGVNIGGETNTNIVINGIIAVDAGNYRCVVTNGCGIINSNIGILTVNITTSITVHPSNVTECEGNNANFTVNATGSNLIYQWKKDGVNLVDGGTISGSTTSNLSINGLILVDAGLYTCEVSGSCGTLTSNSATLVVDEIISINTQPQDKLACSGDNINFIVLATGSNLTYQWQKGGVPIGGETNSTFSIIGVIAGDAGTYNCIITNGCGTLTSDDADLTVNSVTIITSDPVDDQVCEGGNTSFTVTATGTTLTYQWNKNGVPLVDGGSISGATTNSLSINGLILGDAGVYTCDVSGSCGALTSAGGTLDVYENISITSQPQNKTGCPGANISFSVTATGTNLFYQWQKGGVDIGGETNTSLVINGINAGDAGTFRCIITGNCGSVNSNSATLVVYENTVITTDPVDDQLCEGGNTSFTVIATGSNLTYQWNKDGAPLADGGSISGSITNSLSINGLILGDAGVYSCDVSGSCGTLTSAGAILDVYENISITFQPQNKTACSGENISFIVTASGTNLSYQWQKDGVDIAGETNTSLIINGVIAGDAGIFRCIITGNCGSANSNPATLVVYENTVITTDPVDDQVCEGSNTSFTVVATGSNLTYQWNKDGVPLADGGSISGATTNSLSINGLVLGDDGVYSCDVSGSCGVENSNLANLIVDETTVVTLQPVSFSVLEGGNATFTVAADGSTLSYNWYKDGVLLFDGGSISGANTTILTITGVVLADAGAYHCVVSGTCGNVNSTPADLTVNSSSLITTQPIASVTKCEGEDLNLTIVASGGGLTYQWKKDGVDLVDGGNISGSTTSNLNITNLLVTDAGAYTCIVKGTESSTPSIVTVNPLTVITVQPTDATKCAGDNVLFVVNADGESLNYQWKKDNVDIVGETNTNLSINPVAVGDAAIYTCEVTGSCGTVISDPATLIVYEVTIINIEPVDQNICEGSSTTLSVDVSGDNLTYQWKKDAVALVDGGTISGSSSKDLVISNSILSDEGIYTCTITGECGNVNTNPALLTISPTTEILVDPLDATKCVGDNVLFVVNADGESLSYQWKKDNVDIAGETNTSLSIDPIAIGDAATYTCEVTGTCGIIVSDPATLIVNEITVINSEPVDHTICEGSSTTLSVDVTGGNLTYQWKKDAVVLIDGGTISGSSSKDLVISNSLLSDDGVYTCTISGQCGNVNTSPARLTIDPSTVINTQAVDNTKCVGENVIFFISADGESLNYQWKKDGVDLVDGGNISGSLTNNLTITNLLVADAGSYICDVSGSCGNISSDPASLDVYENTLITTQPANSLNCEGETVVFNLVAEGGILNYQWKKDGVNLSDGGNISGSLTNNLTIANLLVADAGAYTCIVTGICGQENSNQAILTVNKSTSISVHPVSQGVTEGGNVVFSVSATGSNLTYQWQKDGVDLVDGANISGSTTLTLNLLNLLTSDEGSYRCVVSGDCGTQNSDPASLSVYIPTSITTQPNDLVKCEGEPATFSIVANGSNLTYQWRKDGVDLVDGAIISGTNTPNLTISSVDSSDTGTYTCFVSGDSGDENSDNATLRVDKNIVITLHPISQTKCENDIVFFSVDSDGESLTYQWEKDGVALANGGDISGVNSKMLTINNLDNTDEGIYRCEVTGTCGSVKSDPANLIINLSTVITSQPSSLTRCEGQSASFSIIADGAALIYQWKKDGVNLIDGGNISGSNSTDLIINNLITTDDGIYSCLITGDCGTENSFFAILIVNSGTSINNHPISIIECENEDIFFKVSANGESITYQWEKDGTPLSNGGNIFGATSSALIISDITSANQGTYMCVVSGTCGIINSDPANLEINLFPSNAGTIVGDNTICQGEQGIIFEISVINNATYYNWNLPFGATIVNGDSTRVITVDFSNSSVTGLITVQGINECGSGGISAGHLITVNQIPYAYAGQDRNVCAYSTILEGNITTQGTWNSLGGSASILNPTQYNSVVENLQQGENYFVWTVTSGDCSANDTVLINNKKIDVNAGSDQTICDTKTYLDAETPTIGEGEWSVISNSGYFDEADNPKTLVYGLLRGDNVFKWSVTNDGCSSVDTVVITNDLPTYASAGYDQNVGGSTAILNANIPDIGTGIWTLLYGSAVIADSSLYNTQVDGLNPGENKFRWTITYNECVSSDEVIITNETPGNTSAGIDQLICATSTTLEANQPILGYGEWSVFSGSAIFEDYTQHDTYVYGLGYGNNVLVWKVKEILFTYDTVVITNASPTPANAGPDRSICSEDIELQGNNVYIGNGIWTIVGGSTTFADSSNNNTTISSLGLGANTLRWTTANQDCETYDEVIIVNDNPTLPYAGEDQVLCSDSATLYNNVPEVGIGEWSIIGGSANFGTTTVTNLAAGDNILKWTIANNQCSLHDTVIITNNMPTTANVGADMTVCADSVNLTGNFSFIGDGIWSITSGSGILSDSSINNTTVTNLSLGINILRWTITNIGCSSYDEIEINYDLIIADAGNDQAICSETTTLNASIPSPGTGLWTVIGGSGSANFLSSYEPNTIVSELDQCDNILLWTVSNNQCYSSDTVIITNNLPTTANAGVDQAICSDSTIVTANVPLIGNGKWDILNGSATIENIDQHITSVTALGNGVNTLKWTITQNGCTSSDEVVITNNLPTVADAGVDQTICKDSTHLAANYPTIGNGEWSIIGGSATFEDLNVNDSKVNNLGFGNNTLLWTINNNGCISIDTVLVTNNSPTPSNAGPDLTLCSNTVTLSANDPGNLGSGEWFVINGSGTFANSENHNPTATVEDLSLGNNILRWIITNEGCTSSDDIIITNNLPTTANAGQDQQICADSTNLYANYPLIGTGYWLVTGGYALIEDSSMFNTKISDLGYGENFLTWTINNKGCKTNDVVKITNNLSFVDAGSNQEIYSPSTTLIGNNHGVDAAGEWIVVSGNGSFENKNNYETVVNNVGANANTYAWTITKNECTVSDEVIITYYVLPVAQYSVSTTDGCPPLEVNFINNSIGGITYLWDLGDGSTSNESGNLTHTYDNPGIYFVNLTVFGSAGLYVDLDTIITVHNLPIADFVFVPDTIYIPDQQLHCNNTSIDGYTYFWDFGDGSTSKNEHPIHKYTKEGEFDIKLLVWTENNCFDSITYSILVKKISEIIFPTAFTPNPNGPSDGSYSTDDFSNDVFYPIIKEDLISYNLEIYNRWGILIFKSNDVYKGWDGYYRGELLKEGVYVWRVSGILNNGKPFNKAGNILLLYN
ncbi:MAG: immunoglobulin domain-containing protein [Bacteroidales bacterium]|nr:immunoglobulin domain-containing protein [Bacteroidales bacterium]